MTRTSTRSQAAPSAVKQTRCAIYTRKSTEEGLQQDFNTLDAQRESAEAYIAAQKHEGWVCLPDRYDDGGFTGGNLDRPAAQRLMKDIEAGRIDCVVVYKVDRLSRSLMDFARIMEIFDRNKVSFVSVTQQFNTTQSMGRLTLNILLSFAQFEREIISERTRNKMAAARRKGKFAGGRPLLGYDLISNPAGPKLVVNDDEAERVRTIFALYLKHQSLMPTVNDLAERGWASKRWQTKAGKSVGGRTFDTNSLFQLLTNVTYTGKVRHKEEVFAGEHAAIVDEQIWQRVQAQLQHNGRSGGGTQKNKHGALLRGIVRCSACNCAMTHAFTARGSKRYRYYVCSHAQKRGWHTCPSKSVPAGEIEKFVVDHIKNIGRDPAVIAETLRQGRAAHQHALEALQKEDRTLQRELAHHNAALRQIAGAAQTASAAKLADLQEQIRTAEQRTTTIREQIVALSRDMVDEREVAAALSVFEPVWDTLNPREQARIIRLLVERVDYNGSDNTLSVTFRPNGIKALAAEQKEIAA